MQKHISHLGYMLNQSFGPHGIKLGDEGGVAERASMFVTWYVWWVLVSDRLASYSSDISHGDPEQSVLFYLYKGF